MKHILGAASAATLGFIHGDLSGAYKAYKLYKNYANSNMARGNTKRKHPHGHSVTTPTKRTKFATISPPSSRRSSIASSNSSRSSRSSIRSSWFRAGKVTDRKMAGRGSVVAIARRKKKIKTLHKRPRRVHVSKRLREKVKKVIAAKDPSGYYQEIYYNYVSNVANNVQTPDFIRGPTVDSTLGEFFSPTSVLNAASILWNGKDQQSTYAYNDSKNFNYENSKINVVKQWMTIKYRNNTQRTYYVNIYACQRKVSEPNSLGINALSDWSNNLTLENSAGVNVGSVAAPGGITTSRMYATPYLCKSVTDKYNIECTKVQLAPGEEYTYTLTGPSMMYDFRKYFQSGSPYFFNKKTNVSVFHVVYNDIIGTSNGIFSRVGNADAAAGYALAYEVNCYYKLEMPEQAGITWLTAPTGASSSQALPVSGGTTYLGNRHDAYAIYNSASAVTGTLIRVEREQPSTIGAS